jgi:hypothetical protein
LHFAFALTSIPALEKDKYDMNTRVVDAFLVIDGYESALAAPGG